MKIKLIWQITALSLVFFILVPFTVVSLGNLLSGKGIFGEAVRAEENQTDKNNYQSDTAKVSKLNVPKKIKVWKEDEGRAVSVDFEEYVLCVVASEMPNTFESEALKAQSVAARTFAMAKIQKYEEKKPESHPNAPVCSSTHCQVYKTEDELIACHSDSWGTSKSGFEKIKAACKATEGELLYYDGQLVMQPLFFSSSGGQTENSEDVFVSAVPYLVSVSSPYEQEATHRNEEKAFTTAEFEKALQTAFPKKEFGALTRENIKILSRTAGGRVNEMQIGDVKLKGTEVRNALGLSSALFSVSFVENENKATASSEFEKYDIVFTSNGSGHGVGMSQYGANGMAKKGADYREILKHYYCGTEVF